jgi:hypothetical protein
MSSTWITTKKRVLFGAVSGGYALHSSKMNTITVESTWLGNGVRPTDLTSIVNNFRNQFTGSALTKGQQISMMYENNMMLLTVKSDVNGIMTINTNVGIMFM